jgi:hypothetical protein
MTHRITPDIVPESAWFKSSYSAENATNCVEVAGLGSVAARQIGIRDSKNPGGPALLLPPGGFAAFITDVREGRLDP